MNIKCIAIDDEPLALRQLTGYLQKVPFFDVVGSYPSALQALRQLEEQKVDAVFLDIEMPDLNGLDFVRALKEPPLIVFTTAYSEYALPSYEVEAVDYLLKPFGMSKIIAAANKVKKRFELTHAHAPADFSTDVQPAQPDPVPAPADDVIFVKTDYKVVSLHISQIVYVEGMAEYLRIHIEGEPKPLITLQRMKNLEERLAGKGFMRVHRSYIIKLSHIASVSKTRVSLDTGEDIPVGESYRETLNQYVAGKSLSL